MPSAPRKPCRYPGCKQLSTNPYCDTHTIKKVQEVKARDKYRGSASSRGYDWRWSQYSKKYREQNPLCVMCQTKGILKLAECVDHIVPVKDGQNDPLFWEPKNHQSLCRTCHSIKTAEEDGAFGNVKVIRM